MLSTRAQLNEEDALGLLKHLNSKELGELMENDAKLEEMINDSPQIKHMQTDKQTLLASNKSLADYNLSREPMLLQNKSLLADTYDRGAIDKARYDELKDKLESHRSSQTMDTLLALLQTEAAKSEEQSEDIADKFLDGEMDLEVFIEHYGAQRKITHMRKAKAEKMSEMMRQTQGMNNGPSSHIASPPPPQYAMHPQYQYAPTLAR